MYTVEMVEKSPDFQWLRDYYDSNKKYWSEFSKRIEKKSDKVILVDMLAGSPAYLIGNATIAKYLQEHYGCDVVAIAPGFSAPIVKKICQSFCIDKMIIENQGASANGEKLDRIMNKVRQGANQANDFKKYVLGLKFGKVPVGDLIYDYCLRTNALHELTEFDGLYSGYFSDALLFHTFYSDKLKEFDVAAVVMGHMVYSRYAILARLALSKGIPVYSRTPGEAFVSVRKYNKLEDAIDGNSYELRFKKNEFEYLWQNHREKLIDGGKQELDARMGGTHRDVDAGQAFSKNKKHYTREDVEDICGLPKGRNTVYILTHVMCDAPHVDGKHIYSDYYDWVVETVKIAIQNRRVNWVFKPHPTAPLYEEKVSVEEIVSGLIKDQPHIALSPPDLNASALPKLADAIVTVTGTACMELPFFDIPCITATAGRFSEIGFSITCRTEEDYKETLMAIENLPKPTQEQKERALAYLYLTHQLARVRIDFIPEEVSCNFAGVKDNNRSIGYWKGATAIMQENPKLEDNQFYCNFQTMLKRNDEHMLNYDWLDEDQ